MLLGQCLEAQSANILDPVNKIITLDSKYSNTKQDFLETVCNIVTGSSGMNGNRNLVWTLLN